MDIRPIGVFDSGIGGLTVFSEIAKRLPNEDIIYLGDTKRFPYGIKSQDTIIEITKKNIEFLLRSNVKIVVIACGTATSQALDAVKNLFDVPIIGVIEPTILSLAKDTCVNTIGVIATVGTIRSNAWEKEIKDHIKNVEVVNKACSLLAGMAEEGWVDNEIAKLAIKEYLKDFKTVEIDKLILGCTHYSLFQKIIKDELGKDVEIIDTGDKVAIYLEKLLKESNKGNNQANKGKYNIYLTDMETHFLKFGESLLNQKIEIKKVDID
ncbi:MAG: glutamate racemase [Oscillospiraceae bacterium]|nr:glutamate racemase [Oscillospiraceae bacterium]